MAHGELNLCSGNSFLRTKMPVFFYSFPVNNRIWRLTALNGEWIWPRFGFLSFLMFTAIFLFLKHFT